MLNFFCLCAFFLALLLPVYSSAANETDLASASESKDVADLPIAEKLVRYRRQPPYALLKHTLRTTKRSKLRRRIKAPKIKYGPPNYRHGEPIKYYKPSFASHIEKPTFSIDDFQHLKFDGADLKIPASSYEAQSMDLDFYNQADLYGAHKFPSLEYNFDPPTSHSEIRAPHQKYGLPSLEHSPGPSFGSYETPESFVSQHYPQSYSPPELPPPHIPATRYGVPTAPAAPPPPSDYSIYEQKIPNSGYQQHFAEPPTNSNYEIAYSPPNYELSSTSYQANGPQHGNNEYVGPSYLPAPPPPPPSQPYPHEDYAPPPNQELPLSPNHKFPSFDFPKSSYEVPIYDPIPFEASSKDEQESYPPILEHSSSNSENIAAAPEPSNEVGDAHPSGSQKTTTKRIKRKRRPTTPAAAIVPTKHTLDVPELQQAFETEHRLSHSFHRDADVNESQHHEQKRRPATFVTTTTRSPLAAVRGGGGGGAWSPMRVRTSTPFLPTIVTSTPATRATTTQSRNRQRATSRYRSTQTSNASSHPSTQVTIQKSHSQSYYDGTIAPPSYQQINRGTRPTRIPFRRGPSASSLEATSDDSTSLNKRTTKSVFDTTYFKSPLTDKEIERRLNVLHQILPKNHKLF